MAKFNFRYQKLLNLKKELEDEVKKWISHWDSKKHSIEGEIKK